MISVVIPAHNEAAVLPRLLDALSPGVDSTQLSIVVVANGCSDDTAAVARQAEVNVIEIGPGGKIKALNCGDAASSGFPRFYVDADVVVTARDLEIMASRLDQRIEAVAPALHLDDGSSSLLVRSYHRYWGSLPSVRHSLAGRGCFGVTATGRDRWDEFPDVVADDQFVNQQFAADEVAIVAEVSSIVTIPATLGALVRRKRRSHRGNLELAATGVATATTRGGWFGVVRSDPRRLVDLPAFLFVTAVVRFSGWRERRDDSASWGADETSRGAS